MGSASPACPSSGGAFMRIWHAVALTAALMSLSQAAFTQAPPASQPSLQPAPAVAQPAVPEGAALRDLLLSPKNHRWVKTSAEGMSTLTLDPEGSFESFVLISRSALMPKGLQTVCKGSWKISGRAITVTHRTCHVGQEMSEAYPDYIIEVVSIDADTLVLKFEEGGVFEFKAQN